MNACIYSLRMNDPSVAYPPNKTSSPPRNTQTQNHQQPNKQITRFELTIEELGFLTD